MPATALSINTAAEGAQNRSGIRATRSRQDGGNGQSGGMLCDELKWIASHLLDAAWAIK